MNIDAIIESLLTYAQEHLLLDDLDMIYTRNQIMDELKLEEYQQYEIATDEIEALSEPSPILDQITAFAVGKGLIGEMDKRFFEAKIMNFLIKRPSEIADVFCDLLKANAAKAFSWLQDYHQKSGYIQSRNVLRQWEAKGSKGKIELFISSGSPHVAQDTAKYPLCGECIENEGYGMGRTLRAVPLELAGESYSWRFHVAPYVSGLGCAAAAEHRGLTIDGRTLEELLDFADQVPSYFIAARECPDTVTHAFYVGAAKLLPMHKAPDLKKLKSAEYPYINITEVDWYVNTLRLSCTNKEKLIEFADKLMELYKKESPDNYISVSVRKLESKYCIELILEDRKLEVKPENRNLKDENPDIYDLMGMFVLPSSLEDEIKQMDLFLTKEVKFNENKMPPQLEKHTKMIAKMLKEIGSTKISSVEAQIDIKEEINNICEYTLEDIRVFGRDEEGEAAKTAFLERAGIR